MSQYFFRLLDINHEGGLSSFTIRYFFREVAKRMLEFGFEAPNVDDVKVRLSRPLSCSSTAPHAVLDLAGCGPAPGSRTRSSTWLAPGTLGGSTTKIC